jgi:hypothetical protein
VEANAVIVILSNIEPVACTNGAARLDLDTIDVTWEEIQESALRAYHTGRIELASRNWERAMVLARRHFGRPPPRHQSHQPRLRAALPERAVRGGAPPARGARRLGAELAVGRAHDPDRRP